MATTLDFYYEAGVYTKDGTVDLTSANVKLALVTQSYTPDLDNHTVWGDVSVNEVAAGNGYTAGGTAFTNATVSRTAGQSLSVWEADNVQFTGLTKTFKYGVVYLDATVNTVVQPLIAVIDFDDTSTTSDISVSDAVYSVQWDTSGIWEFGPIADICP